MRLQRLKKAGARGERRSSSVTASDTARRFARGDAGNEAYQILSGGGVLAHVSAVRDGARRATGRGHPSTVGDQRAGFQALSSGWH